MELKEPKLSLCHYELSEESEEDEKCEAKRGSYDARANNEDAHSRSSSEKIPKAYRVDDTTTKRRKSKQESPSSPRSGRSREDEQREHHHDGGSGKRHKKRKRHHHHHNDHNQRSPSGDDKLQDDDNSSAAARNRRDGNLGAFSRRSARNSSPHHHHHHIDRRGHRSSGGDVLRHHEEARSWSPRDGRSSYQNRRDKRSGESGSSFRSFDPTQPRKDDRRRIGGRNGQEDQQLDQMSEQQRHIDTQDPSTDHHPQLNTSTQQPQASSYCLPGSKNSQKLMEQIQKRKLLWQGNKEKTVSHSWETMLAGCSDAKQADKLKKMIGLREDATAKASTSTSQQQATQDEIAKNLQQQYELARISTHTHRGMGLGFTSQVLYAPFSAAAAAASAAAQPTESKSTTSS